MDGQNGTSNMGVFNETTPMYTRKKVMTVIFLSELTIGFAAQIFNLHILRRKKVRSSSYTLYLRALSVTFLVGIPCLFASIVSKAMMNYESMPYHAAIYAAHLELYLANLFLLADNLIVVLIAVESLYCLKKPFVSLSDSKGRSCTLLSVVAVFSVVVTTPFLFYKKMIGPNEQGGYSVQPNERNLPKAMVLTLRSLVGSTLESFLIALIAVIHILIFNEYHKIRENRLLESMIIRESGIQQRRRGRIVPRMHQLRHDRAKKALLTCLGPIAAYVLSNSLSAIKECLLLAHNVLGIEPVRKFMEGSKGRLFRDVANVALLSNATLAVVLQYKSSMQYGNQVRKTAGYMSTRLHRTIRMAGHPSSIFTNVDLTGDNNANGVIPNNNRPQHNHQMKYGRPRADTAFARYEQRDLDTSTKLRARAPTPSKRAAKVRFASEEAYESSDDNDYVTANDFYVPMKTDPE